MLHEARQEPTSFEELLATLTTLEGVWFWRGSGDATWQLDSTLARRLRRDPFGGVDERFARYWEEDLLDRARHRRFDLVEGVRLNDFELLALLRHHGAATRLVDFSRSALIALWFAVVEHPSLTGELIGFHTDDIAGYHEGASAPATYAEVAEVIAGSRDPWGWSPPGVSARVAAQHSQLLFSEVRDSPHGSLNLPQNPEHVVVIDVTPSVKHEARDVLRRLLDIDFQSMFPDLGGFAQAFSVEPTENPYRW